jgi:hypothetical protein
VGRSTAARTWLQTARPRTSTRKQNATCAAISACIRRRRECGSSPPLSALAGLTAEARSAGARPNSSVTPRVSARPNPSTRQSAGRIQAHRIVRRIDHADDERRGPPGEHAAERGRQKPSHGASTSTSCTRRQASRADRDAQRHLARPRRRLRRHQVGDVGAGDQQHQRHQHAQPRAPAVLVLQIRRRPRPPAPAIASASGKRRCSCLLMPVKPLARSSSKARETASSFARTGSTATPGLQRASVRCQVQSSWMAPGCIMVGTKMSVTVPVSVPVKGSGPTPTIW